MERDNSIQAENRFVASKAADCTLFLEIGLHGFSVAVCRPGEWLMHDSMVFLPAAGQSARIEAAITHLKKNDILYATFSNVEVFFSDPYFTLLPLELEANADIAAWLHFQLGNETQAFQKHNDLQEMGVRLAFQVLPEWELFIKRNFGVVKERHTLFPFLHWISRNKLQDITVWCYALEGGLFIAATNGNALLFANYFDVHAPEDFSYAVLMVYEVLSLNHKKPFRCLGKGAYLSQGMELLGSFLSDASVFKPAPNTAFHSGDFPFVYPLHS